MSHLQAVQDAGVNRAGATSLSEAQRFLVDPGEVKWVRTDWVRPLGAFTRMSTTARLSRIRGEVLHWNAVEFETLWLGHQAALLLLQGMQLSKILIPNHQLEHPSLEQPLQVAHLLLRVDPWEYWLPRPRLTNILVATLPRDLPAGLSPSEVLAALAFDSAS